MNESVKYILRDVIELFNPHGVYVPWTRSPQTCDVLRSIMGHFYYPLNEVQTNRQVRISNLKTIIQNK